MDAAVRERLQKTIRTATEKKARLEPEALREIKDICKLDSAYVEVAFEVLMGQLEANHPLVGVDDLAKNLCETHQTCALQALIKLVLCKP